MACGLSVPFGKRRSSLPARVVEARVGDPEVLLEAEREGLLRVPGVDADELDALVLGLLRHLLEVLGLGAAGAAPRSPEVQDDDLALVVGDVEVLAVQGRPVELRARPCARPWRRWRFRPLPVTKFVLPPPPALVPSPLHADRVSDAGHGGGGEQGEAASGSAARGSCEKFRMAVPGILRTPLGARKAPCQACLKKVFQPPSGALPTWSVRSFASTAGSCTSSQSANCRKETRRTSGLSAMCLSASSTASI